MARPEPYRSDDDLIKEIEANLQGRLQLLPQPPAGFDPLEAPADELARYGLPPRPDAQQQSAANAAWQRLFVKDPPLEILETTWPSFRVRAGKLDYRLAHDRGGKRLAAATRHETSRNWSGAFITAGEFGPFTQVFGAWKVPTPKLPTGAPDDDYRCSTWLGLDGQRRHSRGMPQLGTTQRIVVAGGKSTPEVYAWYQWWLRDHKIPPLPFALPLSEGQVVRCSLTVLSPFNVLFFVRNMNTGQAARLPVGAPGIGGSPWPVPIIPVPVRGAAAEWVTERPTDLVTDRLYPLPDYGSVTFRECLAVESPEAARQLDGARLIRMVEVRENPHRLVTISKTEKMGKDGDEVQTSYQYEGT